MSNAKKKRVSLRGSKGTIQRVLKLIQPYRGLVLFTLLLAAVTVLTTLYAPILSGRGVDLIVGQGNVNFPALGKIAIQFGVTVCVTSICQWLMNMVNNRITFQVVRDIRVQAFQHMEILPLSYMDAHKPGDAISRINTDVEQFSDGLLMGFTQLFTGILTIVGTLGFMLSIDWRITLIVVVLTPLSIFVAKFIAEHTYDMFRVQSETRAELTIGGGITVGELSVLLNYANQYTKPFNDISGVMTELQNALACAQRVFDFIDEAPILPDAPDAVTLPHGAGSVEFGHVKFRYVPDVPLIEDMNLRVQPGQRIALVGPTGCGKTTLVNLLMRFYEINGGTLKVDGHPIDTVTRDSLRGNLGMVLQETWLKAGTVADNIAYGKPDATREEIIDAAKRARAHSFICRLPQGYDTVIAEDGGNISQGQKQLLCIARVMLRKPPILILDEATSSIDTRTEVLVQDAFEELMKGRTSFIVAHRLSTIKNADQILVMKAGNIIERGTHEELLARGGFYANLYASQFAKA